MHCYLYTVGSLGPNIVARVTVVKLLKRNLVEFNSYISAFCQLRVSEFYTVWKVYQSYQVLVPGRNYCRMKIGFVSQLMCH